MRTDVPRKKSIRLSTDYMTGIRGVAELSQLFPPLWQSTYLSGCQMANDAYHMSVNAERLYRFARTGGAQRVKRITETTKEGIRKVVAIWLDTL